MERLHRQFVPAQSKSFTRLQPTGRTMLPQPGVRSIQTARISSVRNSANSGQISVCVRSIGRQTPSLRSSIRHGTGTSARKTGVNGASQTRAKDRMGAARGDGSSGDVQTPQKALHHRCYHFLLRNRNPYPLHRNHRYQCRRHNPHHHHRHNHWLWHFHSHSWRSSHRPPQWVHLPRLSLHPHSELYR